MRKVIATEFASLDGFMDDPGSWTSDYWDEGIAGFKQEELFAAEAMILGRTTYDAFVSVWPAVEPDPVGFTDRMNSMPKYVASRTRSEFDWNATGLDDLVPGVAALKESDGGDLLVTGSSSVLNQLLQAGLVDELRLLVYPVVLRGSLPLFTVPERVDLTLASSHAYKTGVLGLTYTSTH